MNKNLLLGGSVYDLTSKTISIPTWAQSYITKGKQVPAADRYRKSPTAYTCVQMRARALSAIPWAIATGEDTYAADGHPLVVMLSEVNPDMNWVDLIRATEADMLIFGKAFWLKLGSNNRTYYLQRLVPSEMVVKTDNDGIMYFERTIDSGKPEIYQREEVIYFHDYNPTDEYKGVAPIDICADAIDVEIRTSQFSKWTFENYGIPPVIFETDHTLQEPEFNKLKNWFRRTFQGAKNAGKTAFMDKGLKANVIGFPIKDMDLSGVRAEARRDICATLGVPPAIAGAWEAANFASATEQHRSLYEDTIIPRAEYFASVLNAELVSDFGSNLKFVWQYDELPIMQEDRLQEAERAGILVREGVVLPRVIAVEMGYQEDEAGIGPVQTRIIDDQQEAETDMRSDLNKWQRKAENALSKGRNAQVDFESEHIPASVNQYIFSALDGATKSQVSEIFGGFINVS